ncbi:Rrs1 protein-like protein [Cladochytrium replicatum]|nr:Rrs1 protein-like protein [Cladochytrium replicatum]
MEAIEVKTPVPIDLDLGNLTALNINLMDSDRLKDDTETYLRELSRDTTQVLINALFNQPITKSDDGVFASLPAPTIVIPRAKPLPSKKPLTRWEKFAKAKGIQKKRKSRVEFDEETGNYTPRYGYKGADDKLMDWAIEVKPGDDPMEDPYAANRKAKSERVAKNRKQKDRNMRDAGIIGTAPVIPTKAFDERKSLVKKKLLVSKVSTASMGKFDRQIEGDEKLKTGKRRKFESATGSVKIEKDKALNIANRVLNPKPKK